MTFVSFLKRTPVRSVGAAALQMFKVTVSKLSQVFLCETNPHVHDLLLPCRLPSFSLLMCDLIPPVIENRIAGMNCKKLDLAALNYPPTLPANSAHFIIISKKCFLKEFMGGNPLISFNNHKIEITCK